MLVLHLFSDEGLIDGELDDEGLIDGELDDEGLIDEGLIDGSSGFTIYIYILYIGKGYILYIIMYIIYLYYTIIYKLI